ncbi:MAG: polysaccharide biosynthesis C-terminal domain-containing protein, partial [Phycisphaerales bacterium]|nr:polysaccharide biosynthesis C-terminal domain-containing protein [Phycisphaerales bacterium]
NGFSETMRRGLRSVMFIGLPASAGLILVREPLTAAVFQGGAFTSEDTLTVSAILLGYAPAVWAFSMCGVLTKGFYARGNTMTPVKVAIGCMVLNSILNVTLIWTPLNTAGLAWSTSVCAVLQAAILMSLISKEARPFDGSVFVSWLKASLLTLAMSTVVVYLLQLEIFQSSSWEGSIQILAIIVPVAAGFYALGSIALRMPEFKWALGFKSQ